MLVTALLVLFFLVSLPYWLPKRVAKLRNWLFATINGSEGVHLPNASVGPEEAMLVYRHPLASGRAEGATLSDLFWYWMEPGAHIHQENMEAGWRYDTVKRTTRKLLAVKPGQLFALADKYLGSHLAHSLPEGRAARVALTSWFFPMFAGFYYELLFGHEATPAEIKILTAHAANFLSALKCTQMRDMNARRAATAVLAAQVAAVPSDRFEPLAAAVNKDELTHYLQTNFFSTGVVQMSEAMAHILLSLAHHPQWQVEFAETDAKDAVVQSVVKEAFRLYPLFGISHRILQGDITLSSGVTLPAGTVICLDHEAYNQAAYDDADRFAPERWYDKELAKIAIPFGVKENRSCPAEGFVLNLTGHLVPEFMRRFDFASGAEHTRSLANFAPCYLIPKNAHLSYLPARLWFMRQWDGCQQVVLSLRQVVAGTLMVREARGLRLCASYFEQHDGARDIAPNLEPKPVANTHPGDGKGQCPDQSMARHRG